MIKTGVTANRMRSRPVDVINGLPNMPAFHVSNVFGFRGPLNTVVTACAAGTQAIGVGTEEIRRGAADVMLVGGTEAMISEVFFATFEAMRAVTTQNDDPPRASRPFDATRDGFVIGEGTAIFVLESLEHALARGARIYAEVLGWGESADAYHIAAPDPEAKGAALCMRNALADAGISPDDVSYINAHAAGTPLGDAHETKGIKDVFGQRAYEIPISSTKSMVGHLFGGAGADRSPGLRLRRPHRHDPPNHQLSHARPRVRPGLRAQRGAPDPGQRRHVQLLRPGRPECLLDRRQVSTLRACLNIGP